MARMPVRLVAAFAVVGSVSGFMNPRPLPLPLSPSSPSISLTRTSHHTLPNIEMPIPATSSRFYASPAQRCPTKLNLAPSGIDGLPFLQQQLAFAGVFLGLGLGTAATLKAFDAMENILPDGWFAKWKATWPLLGALYVLAGFAHFGAKDAFLSIYPPLGTWGLWALPGSAEFHVAWTGVAEVAGGAGLLLGSAINAFAPTDTKPLGKSLAGVSAAALALLTVAVTPANIYMWSHGAIMVGAGPDGPLPVPFHYVRFVMQVLLLSFLSGIALTPPTLPEAEQ
mmetsp:Transcript_24883/g.50532  ORF Transcript_24883/g.50532 Transcript_24883/m.50532 type:complete len:282 (+) Transcript_24883:110-955(+)